MLEPARLRRAYERLRADAVAGGPQAWRWGGSVLERAGVAAWMRVWNDHVRAEQELGMNRSPERADRGHPQSGAWGAATGGPPVAACGAGTLPVDAEAVVRLLAQLVRGFLDAAPGAGIAGVGVSA